MYEKNSNVGWRGGAISAVAVPVFSGPEKLNVPLVDSLIKSARPEILGVPYAQQCVGGASRLTYLLSYPSESDFVVKISLEKCQQGKRSNLRREYDVLTQMRSALDYSPVPVEYHDGSPKPSLLIMERAAGLTLCPKTQKLFALEPGRACALSREFISKLADIHSHDPSTLIAKGIGRPGGYLTRQLDFWVSQYRDRTVSSDGCWDEVLRWLMANVPDAVQRPTVVHNDYRLDNLLVSGDLTGRISAVLDWEMATAGDPLLDLGFALAYWISERDPPDWHRVRWQPSHLPGMLSRTELVEHYANLTGRDTRHILFYYVLGILRKSCITRNLYLQRTEYSDERIRNFLSLDKVLENIACFSIQHGTL